MNIDNLKQILELLEMTDNNKNLITNKERPFKVGENYLIRTVTMILVGRLEAVYDTEFVLSSASWIADTGRFYDALKTGNLDEVEPFTDDVIVGRGSLIDATIWTNKLPTEQK